MHEKLTEKLEQYVGKAFTFAQAARHLGLGELADFLSQCGYTMRQAHMALEDADLSEAPQKLEDKSEAFIFLVNKPEAPGDIV